MNVSQFYKMGIEKQGFLTGLEIFILFSFNLKGLWLYPEREILEEGRNERRWKMEKQEGEEGTRKIRAGKKR